MSLGVHSETKQQLVRRTMSINRKKKEKRRLSTPKKSLNSPMIADLSLYAGSKKLLVFFASLLVNTKGFFGVWVEAQMVDCSIGARTPSCPAMECDCVNF